MKKISVLLSACSFAFILSCSTKKQPGEEYYDPNYKPQTSTPTATETEVPVNSSPAENTPADGTKTENETAVAVASTDKAAPTSGTTPTGSSDPKKDEAVIAAVPKDKLPASPAGADFTKGKNLIAKSDCLACHKDDVKLLGPAYVEVAKKYEANEANISKLVTKIIKGGSGVWGEIPMSPHPDLPQADAREMVKYILSLKK